MRYKLIAILLAVFMWSIGLHKLYLNQVWKFFLYLFGFIVFSFAFTNWYYVTIVIAMIEAIHIFFMKQEEFNILFNYEYMKKQEFFNNWK